MHYRTMNVSFFCSDLKFACFVVVTYFVPPSLRDTHVTEVLTLHESYSIPFIRCYANVKVS